MARKIIPLKRIGPKRKKNSPFKVEDWEIEANQWLDPVNLLGLAPEFDEFGVNASEKEYGRLKQGLMETDVTQNFYKDIANPYAGLEDPFASLQNTAEDLTIDQKKFEQQERTLQRGLSQTLQSSKEKGTFDAQTIANELSKASGDIAADIGTQESANQRITVQAANELQLKKAGSKRETDMMVRKGAHETQMQLIKGEEDALSRDLNKQQALLGLISGELARADAQKAADENFLGINWSW